jgi:hypothetical protein
VSTSAMHHALVRRQIADPERVVRPPAGSYSALRSASSGSRPQLPPRDVPDVGGGLGQPVRINVLVLFRDPDDPEAGARPLAASRPGVDWLPGSGALEVALEHHG